MRHAIRPLLSAQTPAKDGGLPEGGLPEGFE